MNYKEKCYLRKTPEYQKITRKSAVMQRGITRNKTVFERNLKVLSDRFT